MIELVDVLYTESGQAVCLTSSAKGLLTDTSLIIWANRTATVFPVSPDGLIADETATALENSGITLTEMDVDQAVKLRCLLADIMAASSGVELLPEFFSRTQNFGLEIGSRTRQVVDRFQSRSIDRLDDATPLGFAEIPGRGREVGAEGLIKAALHNFRKSEFYDFALLAQRPSWPVSGKINFIGMMASLSASLKDGAPFLASLTPQVWPTDKLTDEVRAQAQLEGYDVHKQVNHLSGVATLRLRTCGRNGAPIRDIVALESALLPTTWCWEVIERSPNWTGLTYLDENMEPLKGGSTDPHVRWFRAERTRR